MLLFPLLPFCLCTFSPFLLLNLLSFIACPVAGPHACSYAELISAVKAATGKTWLKAYKPKHGGLVEFLKK